jgi:AcrR family transcriptional regulator
MAREAKILDAAADLFRKRGFAAVGVDEIGRNAGVTGPAIYRHFKGKDEILGALFDEGMDELTRVTAGSFDDPWDELRHIARNHALQILNNHRIAAIWLHEQRSLTEEHRRRFLRRARKYEERWIGVLERCLPDVPEDAILTAAYSAFGALKSVDEWPKAIKDEEHVDQLVDMVVDGIRALESAKLTS